MRSLRIRAAALAAVVTAAAVVALAAPAAAGTAADDMKVRWVKAAPTRLAADFGTHLYPYYQEAIITRGSWEVRIDFGFDYNPATNNLRAYTQMWSNSGSIHLQTEPLRLGDRNGVLKDKYANSQIGLLNVETDPVSCHKPYGVYRSRVYFSIRWPDGVLASGSSPVYEDVASYICR